MNVAIKHFSTGSELYKHVQRVCTYLTVESVCLQEVVGRYQVYWLRVPVEERYGHTLTQKNGQMARWTEIDRCTDSQAVYLPSKAGEKLW